MKQVFAVIVVATLGCCILFMPAYGDDKTLRIKPTEGATTPASEKWAILIGIDKYDDIGINPLKYTVKDVEELYNVITTVPEGFKPDNVILMTPNAPNPTHRPTRNNIIAILNSWFSLPKNDNDMILLYYSGHGAEDKQVGKAYILPQDVKTSALNMTAIDIEYLKDVMRNSKAQKKILILDACHSGAGKAAEAMGKGLAKSIDESKGLVTLASCDIDEASYEMNDTKHGAFTYFLMEALKGKADRDKNGELWASEVNYYVWDNTRKWAAKNGLQQTPKYVSAVQGDPVLAKADVDPPDLPIAITLTPNDKPPSNAEPISSFFLKNTWYGRTLESLMVPGLGQHSQGRHTRGFIYEAIIFTAGVTALWTRNHHQSTLDKYLDVQDRLRLAIKNQRVLTSEILVLLTEQEKTYNKARSARNLTLASQITLGVVWGINVIDAGMMKPLSKKRKVVLETNFTSKDGQILLSLQF